jgi:hypothetical protein
MKQWSLLTHRRHQLWQDGVGQDYKFSPTAWDDKEKCYVLFHRLLTHILTAEITQCWINITWMWMVCWQACVRKRSWLTNCCKINLFSYVSRTFITLIFKWINYINKYDNWKRSELKRLTMYWICKHHSVKVRFSFLQTCTFKTKLSLGYSPGIELHCEERMCTEERLINIVPHTDIPKGQS